MILLQTYHNPEVWTVGTPYHVFLPGWANIMLITTILTIAVIVYFQIRKVKKSGLTKEEVEQEAFNRLLGVTKKEKKKERSRR
ncbi:hypothetical protein RCC89_01995 [Cytophagaceae bacterium ABcell3]|nr:hypothetical protein RCC89_01995 [Cytophagaceae bacterium ABcell3]